MLEVKSPSARTVMRTSFSCGPLAMVKGWRCQPSRASRLTRANWPGRKAKRSPERSQPDLEGRVVDGLDRRHLVVVGAREAPGEQLAVEVEGEPDAAGDDVGPAQQLRAEDGGVHEPVREAEGEEEPGEAVEAAPQPVAADPPADEADRRGLHERARPAGAAGAG